MLLFIFLAECILKFPRSCDHPVRGLSAKKSFTPWQGLLIVAAEDSGFSGLHKFLASRTEPPDLQRRGHTIDL